MHLRKLEMRFDFARNSFGFLFAPCNYGRGKNKQRVQLVVARYSWSKVYGQVQSHFELFHSICLGVAATVKLQSCTANILCHQSYIFWHTIPGIVMGIMVLDKIFSPQIQQSINQFAAVRA